MREAGETERKRLQADLDQQLKQRAAALLEVQNERDSLQTQAEALEQANKAVSLQRDEIARQLREKERINQELADELEEQREQSGQLNKDTASCRSSTACSAAPCCLPSHFYGERSRLGGWGPQGRAATRPPRPARWRRPLTATRSRMIPTVWMIAASRSSHN